MPESSDGTRGGTEVNATLTPSELKVVTAGGGQDGPIVGRGPKK